MRRVETAPHVATEKRNEPVVQQPLKKAAVSIEKDDKETAMQMAQNRDHEKKTVQQFRRCTTKAADPPISPTYQR
jgi:hypothetical protein